jgi:hypothetical protein
MKQYTINVRRILREDANVTIEAESVEEAIRNAILEASSNPESYVWDCYDNEYFTDEEDAVQDVEPTTI